MYASIENVFILNCLKYSWLIFFKVMLISRPLLLKKEMTPPWKHRLQDKRGKNEYTIEEDGQNSFRVLEQAQRIRLVKG
jgi:hypothetical protein